jgi:endonuclease-8
MPEGDTIFRAAARLRPVLSGQTIIRATGASPQLDASRLEGCQVQATAARGKHLLIHLDNAHAIHSHLGMHGSWHVYQRDSVRPETLRRRVPDLALELAASVCVCLAPKTLEILSDRAIRRHPYLSRLGPDLLGENFDVGQLIPRLRVRPELAVGDAVMNQTLVCGIGNVYKSEVLFLERVNPFIHLEQLTDKQLIRLLSRARELMRRNVDGHRRTTRFGRDGQRLWVYRRQGERCLVCGTAIRMRRQGNLGRSTYWCPTCQRPA